MWKSSLISLFLVTCGSIFLIDQIYKKRILEFPFIFVGTWTFFVFPRLWLAEISENNLAEFYRKEGIFIEMVLFASGCIAAGLLGYMFVTKPKRHRAIDLSLRDVMLVRHYSIFLTIVSWSAVALLAGFAGGFSSFFLEQASYKITWEGLPVYLIFVARFIYVPIFLLAFLYFRYRYSGDLILLIVSCVYPILNIVLLFRRSELVFLGMALAYPAIVYGKIYVTPVRVFAAVLGIFSAVLVFPVLRGTSSEHIEIGTSTLLSAVEENFVFKPNSEIAVAAFRFFRVRESGDLQWGSIIPDAIVKQFVPAGLVGKEFKNRLLFNNTFANDLDGFWYSGKDFFYITPMGFSQAYEQFAFGGTFIFFVIGGLGAVLFKKQHRGLGYSMLYALMIPPLVVSVSNDLQVLITRLITYWLLATPLIIMGIGCLQRQAKVQYPIPGARRYP